MAISKITIRKNAMIKCWVKTAIVKIAIKDIDIILDHL